MVPRAGGRAIRRVGRPHRVEQRPGAVQGQARVVAGVERGAVRPESFRLDARRVFPERPEEDAVRQGVGPRRVRQPDLQRHQPVPGQVEDAGVVRAVPPLVRDQPIRFDSDALHAPARGLVGARADELGGVLGRGEICAARLADPPRLAAPAQPRQLVRAAVMPYGGRHRALGVPVAVRRDPGPGRVQAAGGVPPVRPALLQPGDLLGALAPVNKPGDLVADAPAEHGGVVPVPPDQPRHLIVAAPPEIGRVVLVLPVAAPVRRLVQHADAQFIDHIKIEARVRLRVEPDGVGPRGVEHGEPGPGVAPGHLRDAQKVPRVAPQRERLAVEQLSVSLKAKLAPAEARVLLVESLAVLTDRDRQAIEAGRVWRPEMQPPADLLTERDRRRRAGRKCDRARRQAQHRPAQTPVRFRGRPNVFAGLIDPGPHRPADLHRPGAGRVVAERHLGGQRVPRHFGFDIRFLGADGRNGDEKYVLPDARDGLPPERTGGVGAAAGRPRVVEQRRLADAHPHDVDAAEVDRTRHISLERQKQVEVVRDGPAVDGYLGVPRHGLEVQDQPPPAPRLRNLKRALQPAHLDRVPRFGVGGVAPEVPAVIPVERIDVPRRRHFQRRRLPVVRGGRRQVRGVPPVALPAGGKGNRLEPPRPVQAQLLPQRHFRGLDPALGGREGAGKSDLFGGRSLRRNESGQPRGGEQGQPQETYRRFHCAYPSIVGGVCQGGRRMNSRQQRHKVRLRGL